MDFLTSPFLRGTMFHDASTLMLHRHSAGTGRFGRPTSGMLLLSQHASSAEGPRPHPTTSLSEGIEGLCVAIYPRHLTCSTRADTGCYPIARRRGCVYLFIQLRARKGTWDSPLRQHVE